MQAVQGGHYHIACTRLFEITHKKKERGGVKKGDGIAPGGETVTHPNRYFERSYVIEKQARDEGLGGDEDEEMHAGPAGAGTSAAAAAMAAVGAVMENTGEEEEVGGAGLVPPAFSQESFGDDLMAHLDEQMLLALESGGKTAPAAEVEEAHASGEEEAVVADAPGGQDAPAKVDATEAQDAIEMQQEEQPTEQQEDLPATSQSHEPDAASEEQPSVADEVQAPEAVAEPVVQPEQPETTEAPAQEREQEDVPMEE